MQEFGYPIIGVDESGKGDFFGPLVIAGVLLDADSVATLHDLGVQDSKKISKGKITSLAAEIKRCCPHTTVVIGPEKYNQLYARIKNLNKLLGWGHARVIENLLAEHPAGVAISDKFGKEHFILSQLQEKGRAITLHQIVRGESHLAVAAASIVARDEFVRRMEQLSQVHSHHLPLGASNIVDQAARELVQRKGPDVLAKVAKLHFKNYKKVVC